MRVVSSLLWPRCRAVASRSRVSAYRRVPAEWRSACTPLGVTSVARHTACMCRQALPAVQYGNTSPSARRLAGYSDTDAQEYLERAIEAIIDLAQGRWLRSVVNPNVVPRWGLLRPSPYK